MRPGLVRIKALSLSFKKQRKLGNDLMGDEAALRRFLNDKANAFMRTKPGRI